MDRLLNPQNGQPVVLAKMNGVVKIDEVEFGNFRTRASDSGIYNEYKYRGVWYILEFTPILEDDAAVAAGIASGDFARSPVQE